MSSEFAAQLPLARQAIDRDYLARARPDLFEGLWAAPETRVIALHDGSALARGARLAYLEPREVPTADLLLYLGRSSDAAATPFVAAVLSESAAATLGDDAEWVELRTVGGSLDALDAGLFTEALALANWHTSHAFSPRTGEPTQPALGGWVRRAADDDPAGSRDVFPRTDAAIIVGVTDADDRMLLGANALWPAGRYSLLAGFVEPGESLEHAVVREVFEEAGIRVVDPVYLGSQPWPFPASLMLGFRATVEPGQQVVPDGDEILDLRWFSRDELVAALGEVTLPGSTSIARAILEDWFGGPIDDRAAV
ncbi:NAD(+) diphosphatase [Marisediminicola sp. LYQ85]|uniref:NAD(+) diphosphatase n=1 Tax=Marisediminicola sp. LYQ85 TaxID=3391062 RepID=UPI003983A347